MLADQADQGHQADLRVDVHRGVAQVQWDQRAAHRHRHADQDHQRVAQAFELRGQHQVDDQDGEDERHDQGTSFLDELAGIGQPVMAEAGGQGIGLGGKELHRVANAHARRRHRLQGGRVELVELGQLVGLDRHVEADQGRQRHLGAVGGLDVLADQHFRRQALGPCHLRDHVVGAAVEGEAVDVVLAHQHRQGVADGLHADAQVVGLAAVDVDVDQRAVEVQVGVDHGEQAAGHGRLLDLVHGVEHHAVILGALDHHLHRQAAGGAGQRRQLEGEDGHALDLAHGFLDLGLQLVGAALALFPGAQVGAAERGARAVVAVDHPGDVGFREGGEQAVHAVRVHLGVIDVGVLRGLGHRQHLGLVLDRRQFALGAEVEDWQADEHRHGDGQGDPAVVQGHVKQTAIAVAQPVEETLGATGHRAFAGLAVEQEGAHHRRQGQRHHAGHHHGAGEGEGELLEQRAGQPAHQADGGVHRGQGQGHGDHGAGDLAGADQGRLQRRLAFLDMPVDVLHHDDGVVHHQADGQDHRQQGQQVDAEPEQAHDRRRADQRQRDGHQRDQHAAQRAEEQEDHHGDDHHRLDQGLDHFIDGRLDEARHFEHDIGGHARRHGLADLRHHFLH